MAPAQKMPRELTAEEYEALHFEAVRCTACTPCCMGHSHFLYGGTVLWACQAKILSRKAEERPLSETEGKDPL